MFFLFMIATILLLYGYVGQRAIGLLPLGRWGKVAAWAAVVYLGAATPLTLVARNEGMPMWLTSTLGWSGFLSIGFGSLAFVGLAGVDALRAGRWVVRRRGGGPRPAAEPPPAPEPEAADRPSTPTRRDLLAGTARGGVLGAAALLTGYGVYEARCRTDVRRVEVRLPGLHPDLDGYRMVQLSDLHVGPTIRRPYVETVLAAAADLPADLIAITGDLVDGTVPQLRPHLDPLRELSAPDGVHFVTGNHEYYSGADAWVEEVDRMGFRVLMNEGLRLARGAGSLWLAGVTDYGAGRMLPGHTSDVPAAMAGRRAGEASVLLAHRPRSVYAAEAAGADLMLCGHTHGGQYHPFSLAVALAQPYVAGLHRHGRGQLYVNRGTGYWGPPMRLGIPAEITHLTLRRG